MSDGGKGSAPRPYSVDQKTFSNNWDAIFGKRETKKEVRNDNAGTNTKESNSEPVSGDSKLDS